MISQFCYFGQAAEGLLEANVRNKPSHAVAMPSNDRLLFVCVIIYFVDMSLL